MSESAPTFDPSNFSTEAYSREIEKPWGWEKHLVPPDLPYMMKIIHVYAGKRLSLQIHDTKQESWTLISGPGKVIWENAKGELVEMALAPGEGYTVQIGQKHRLMAGEEGDAEFFEASTPEAGITWRPEDDYARPDETPEQRKKERGEA